MKVGGVRHTRVRSTRCRSLQHQRGRKDQQLQFYQHQLHQKEHSRHNHKSQQRKRREHRMRMSYDRVINRLQTEQLKWPAEVKQRKLQRKKPQGGLGSRASRRSGPLMPPLGLIEIQ